MTPRTPTKEVDIDLLTQLWSPEEQRIARSNQGRYKVRSIDRGRSPLRGGDVVLTERGEAATLSFCFTANSKRYGLTVGHLVNRKGDKIFAFSQDLPNPNGRYPIREIGTVVSLKTKSDSLIFEITANIRVLDLCSSPAGGLRQKITLPRGNHNVPQAPREGTKLIGFAANRRGAVGCVGPTYKGRRFPLLHGDIPIMSVDPGGNEPDGHQRLMDNADCGAMFVDEQRTAWYMHHILAKYSSPNKFCSFGVPLCAVMKSHSKYFGDYTTSSSWKQGCRYRWKVVWHFLRRVNKQEFPPIQVTENLPLGGTQPDYLEPVVSHQCSPSEKASSFSRHKKKPAEVDQVSISGSAVAPLKQFDVEIMFLDDLYTPVVSPLFQIPIEIETAPIETPEKPPHSPWRFW